MLDFVVGVGWEVNGFRMYTGAPDGMWPSWGLKGALPAVLVLDAEPVVVSDSVTSPSSSTDVEADWLLSV